MVAGEGGRVPVGSVFATVILERLVGTFILLPLMIIILGWVEPPLLGTATKASLRVGVWLSGAGVVAWGLILWGFIKSQQRTLNFLHSALAFLPSSWTEKIIDSGESFVGGLRSLPTGINLASFISLSIAIWGCWFTVNLCLFQAFDMTLPLSAALMLMVLQFLSFALPSGPGFMGTYFIAATMSGLLIYGIPNADAFSAAIVHRVIISAIAVFVGLSSLLAESVLSGRPLKAPAKAKSMSHIVKNEIVRIKHPK
jgi:uncharacterized membrane protein YbhN (UPF0104 family)